MINELMPMTIETACELYAYAKHRADKVTAEVDACQARVWELQKDRADALTALMDAEAELLRVAEREGERDDVRAREYDVVDVAWGLVANAYGGNWEVAPVEWRGAAERFRDRYVGRVVMPRDVIR